MSREGSASEPPRPRAFVAMPLSNRLEHIYSKVVKPVLETKDLICLRGDEVKKPGIVVEQIIDLIRRSDIIICDLTGNNPNVYYELGIAHILEKPVIMLSQDAADIPFDTRQWRVIPYADTNTGLLDLRDDLERFLEELFTFDQSVPQARQSKTFPVSLTGDMVNAQRRALFSPVLDFKRYAVKFLGNHGDRLSFDKIESLARDSDEDTCQAS